METHQRSIVKSILWRIIATTVTILLAYVWFGEWASSIYLGLTANGIKAVLYYFHERGWNSINWGRVTGPTSVKESKLD